MEPAETGFGQYDLLRAIGQGGMAETFVAVRRGPGGFEQRVCLKRILPALQEDEEFVRQFLAEARVSARLRHANIAQVIDFGFGDGSHYLVLELVDGIDSWNLLRRLWEMDQTLSPPLVTYIGSEVASALDAAASQGIVHRDISPSNVLLSKAGEVKLTDFGVARALDQPRRTRTGILKGKMRYMPPEYAQRSVYDARSDLFSLGVVLFQMLAGRHPYEGSNDVETVAKSTRGVHAPLASLAPEAPPALVTTIERLIRPNPEERFASAAELLDALESIPGMQPGRRLLGALVTHFAQSGSEQAAHHNAGEQPAEGGSEPEVPAELLREGTSVIVRPPAGFAPSSIDVAPDEPPIAAPIAHSPPDPGATSPNDVSRPIAARDSFVQLPWTITWPKLLVVGGSAALLLVAFVVGWLWAMPQEDAPRAAPEHQVETTQAAATASPASDPGSSEAVTPEEGTPEEPTDEAAVRSPDTETGWNPTPSEEPGDRSADRASERVAPRKPSTGSTSKARQRQRRRDTPPKKPPPSGTEIVDPWDY